MTKQFLTVLSGIGNLLTKRRIWASIFAAIAILLPIFGVNYSIDTESLTNAVMSIITDISTLGAILFPLWSFFFPRE